ncbi:type VI secretion system Vgr family protein [Pantoea phytobeneficialis]|uniref:Type VI secretion system tip protein VgrG n=1 Tax=Pantoea phytobeneficialis TaxID=2052056 RepID=A0AAP9KRI6_9GAMM|nr:type VI secretion system tip protein VgrG [Pantoea phytobeneficialis]MDO6409066.1 type VI secretion system tip protein VgrG [Pantoea phytobeneficialis]QGR08892.1 type VI secretion system tip protein VgrG [Pantoea phytobeneficialis]
MLTNTNFREDNRKSSRNRYLLCFENKDVYADVESFTGEEALSQPWRYAIRFCSEDRDIPPDSLVMKKASFRIRAPTDGNPPETQWQEQREINGVITGMARVAASRDEALYEITLEHPLSLLAHTRRFAIFQNLAVPELVCRVLKSHGMHGYEIDMDGLCWTYPEREMIVQWGETDLHFILRLLSEVGIWFRFEPHETTSHLTVMVFGDMPSRYIFGHKIIALPQAGMSGQHLTIRNMTSSASVVPAAVHTRDYDYRIQRLTALESFADMGNEAPFTRGRDYHYGDIHHGEGDRWASMQGGEAETAWFFARIRHERHLCQRIRLAAQVDDPALLPGRVVGIIGEHPSSFADGMLVVSLNCRGGRNTPFLAELSGIPFSARVAWRPERIARPVIAGTVPARISGLHLNDTLARPDRQGRYRVKFSFDLDEWVKGQESMPVRLARIYAGDRFGVHFPLLDNTEVAIAFEGGDPERPYIAHVLHDVINPDLVNDLNSTRNVIRTFGKNKLRMEDEKGREHIKLASEFGKTQLNIGHLVDSKRQARGAGAELRTQHHASVRAGEGILLTTAAQPNVNGSQLEMAATIRHLEQALSLAYSLQGSAGQAGADAVDTAPQHNQSLTGLNKPGIVAWADAGLVQATPESLQLSAGQDAVITASNNGSVNIFKTLSLAAGQGISAFVRRVGIKLIAASGHISLQAQRGKLTALADQDMQLTSVNGEVQISAKKGLFLHCGGGGIRIHPGGGVEIFSPKYIEQKSPTLSYQQGEMAKIVDPVFADNPLARRVRLFREGDRKHPLLNQAFQVTTSDGSVVEGATDANGHSPLLDLTETEQLEITLIREAKR